MNFSFNNIRRSIRLSQSRRSGPLAAHALALLICACLSLYLPSTSAQAQTITTVQPRTAQPGQTVQLMVQGADLNDSLRIVSAASAPIPTDKIEATQATAALTVPSDAAFGPMSLWLTTATGAVKSHTLFVDDLERVVDNGSNHSLATAQPLTNRSSVEGICDAAHSDYYRLQVAAGERVAVEVHTQQLRSPMDPVVRLLNAAGEALLQVDDSAVDGDCRFSHQFAEAGEYWLQVWDNRNVNAGAAYQLRIGDFPVVTQAFPPAVQQGQSTQIQFVGPDASQVVPRSVSAAEGVNRYTTVAAKFDNGASSAWVPLLCSRYPQFVESPEPTSTASLSLPIGISGRLLQAAEVDNYLLQGTKGQVIRVAARTRSLGSPTLLQMTLFNSAGAKLAETKVGDADEWSFDATLPEDGEYRLEVTDLLKRGGEEFTYYVECTLSGSFAVALKVDAGTREEFLIEAGRGACALTLQIARFGYDGEIELSLRNAPPGLQIVNPRIPAKAAEAKVYLMTDANWSANSLAAVQFAAKAVEGPDFSCDVDSRALRRLKEPFVVAARSGGDGTIVLAGSATTESPFLIEPAGAIALARPIAAQSLTLTLKRTQEAFKAAVDWLPNLLPTGWTGTVKVEGDNYVLSLTRQDLSAAELTQLPVTFFAEFNGHGRMETFSLPVQWFDPIRLTVHVSEPCFQGGRARGVIELVRSGADPQPVTITFPNPPAGVAVPESVVIAADQGQAEFELQFAADAALDLSRELNIAAASQYSGQQFSVALVQAIPTLQPSPERLMVFPPAIELSEARSRQQIVVSGASVEGQSRDWSPQARMISANPEIAQVRSGVVYPLADGSTEILVELGSNRLVIPVAITNMGTPRKVEFESEVLVALSKQGCNSGACHGSPSGKGGFRLSLRAFDLKLDQLTLIREDFGRRTNPLDAEQSLLLTKPLMKVAHGGGKQIHKDDSAYAILRDWIAQGATADPDGTPRITKLEVFPNQKQIMAVRDGGQQLAVTAVLADGRRRDVTHLAAYETSDSAVATVDVHGLVTPHARGEVVILVRLLEYIESVPLMFVADVENFHWPVPPSNNYVDELVNEKLKQLQYLPSHICTDDEFLRRASLDLLGILPTVQESTAFLEDTDPNKRARMIDALLQREEYAKFWALKWGDLLRMTNKLVGDEGVYKYHRWVEQSLQENLPYDEFAKQLLTGMGSTLSNPPANFYRTSTDMNECVETVSQVFLGARLQCAKCHNHPFERWTQDNYYGLGAFFNRVQRRKTDRPGEMFVYTAFTGDVTQPRTGQVMKPWLPQVGSIETANDSDRRAAFAEWLISPSNPYFARIEANRIWSQLFARGIVDPIDDFRDSNPPTNTALLDALAKDFVDSGYDRKHLLRVILNSRTYQASYETTPYNQDDSKYFSHQEPRLLAAEQLLDAINRTLDLQQQFGSLPSGTLATQLPAPDVVKVDFLKVFGQPERSTVCACERGDDSNLGMAIELLNGTMIHEKLRDSNNRFRKALAAGQAVPNVIREIYLAALCRPPTDVELKTALEHCGKNADQMAGVEDVCWALFNTDEFLFQH